MKRSITVTVTDDHWPFVICEVTDSEGTTRRQQAYFDGCNISFEPLVTYALRRATDALITSKKKQGG